MAKKTERQLIVDKLDTVVSLIIRARDERCVICGTPEASTNGHLFTRSAYSTRWDIRDDGNCHQQCRSCNLRHEHDPYPFNNWFINRFGKERWDELYKEHKAVRIVKTWELKELYEELKTIAKEKGVA